MELLKKLCEAHGVPGREEAVRELVISELRGICDEIRTDALGNVIALKKGSGRGPKVMLAAHMDEIGFLVSHIDEKSGFLRIDPVGGFDPRVLMAQRVIVHTEKGDLIGIIGSKPPHILTEEERKKPLELKDLFIDLGLPADEVKKRVSIGDFVTLQQDFAEVGNLVSCKALDDRVGVYVMIEAVRRTKKHVCDIYAVATTQEEVGVRGARVSSFNVAPDIGVALDVTVASDVPGVGEHEQVTKLGAGVAIKIKDSLSISNPKLVRTMRQIAEQKKIKYQLEILPRGGTDAGAIQMTREGVAAITLSIPTRYCIRSSRLPIKDDIQAAIDLLAAFLEVAHERDYSL
jgi:putative aminopeptidase FrvX